MTQNKMCNRAKYPQNLALHCLFHGLPLDETDCCGKFLRYFAGLSLNALNHVNVVSCVLPVLIVA